ncbi:hypothetical protein [Bradyrhizobium paxllaeri]|uniref:hypothetical protein n=1 Tax=Bradyrhizobium paxllaeri TaxID=190148 RepID=UPI0011473884|nr:hypothetical protein [Bradyrhizobium paxllaeri]
MDFVVLAQRSSLKTPQARTSTNGSRRTTVQNESAKPRENVFGRTNLRPREMSIFQALDIGERCEEDSRIEIQRPAPFLAGQLAFPPRSRLDAQTH